jgi:hypothetical protein
MARKPVNFETVRELALALPGVVASMGAWGMAFKAHGKMLACKAVHRSAEEGSLVVRIDLARRAELLAADPKVFYVTPHYERHPAVLVRLQAISRGALAKLLDESRLFVSAEPRAARASSKGPRG